jgi:hypothetical protein
MTKLGDTLNTHRRAIDRPCPRSHVACGRRIGLPLRALGLGALRLGALGLAAAVAGPVRADDRHAGYYYPPPQTIEIYHARGETLPDSDHIRRIGFVVELTRQMLDKPYPPEFVVFAKGEDAEKLLIVALKDDVIDTIYRARALLAMLTSVARATPLFREVGVADYFTFFDLLDMMGFRQLTISDGDDFAHQVEFD